MCELKFTTITFSGRSVSILAPAEVNPGAMMLAPLRMNLMAPLSTCNHGNMLGSEGKRERREERGGREKREGGGRERK
jgi:hypothetical protein